MNLKKGYVSLKGLFILPAILLIAMNICAESYGKESSPETLLPNGYSRYIVFLGDGVYQSVDGSIMTGGMVNANEAGIGFQRNIMGRNDEEIDIFKEMALNFFDQRFGFDAENDPSIFFTAYEVNPLNKIRAVTVSLEKVPQQGWIVHDGGFMAMVVNPAGTTLGGEFNGVNVSPNTAFVFGEYKVVREFDKKDKNKTEEKDSFVIRYRSKEPLTFGPFGSVVRCELDSNEFGPGFNGGMFGPVQLGDGYLQPNIKSVLTFPPLGPNTQCNHDRF